MLKTTTKIESPKSRECHSSVTSWPPMLMTPNTEIFSACRNSFHLEKKFGEVAALRHQYLVTRELSSYKSTYQVMWNTLQDIMMMLIGKKQQKLALRTLGCGIDPLECKIIRNMLEVILYSSQLELMIGSFNPRDHQARRQVDYYLSWQSAPINKLPVTSAMTCWIYASLL